MPNIQEVGFTDPYSPQENEILKRQKMAEMLMAQGASPMDINRNSGMFATRISPLEGLGKVAQSFAGAYGMDDAQKKRAELVKQMQQERAGALDQATRQMQGSPQTFEDASGNYNPQAAQAPNPQGALKALAMSNDPMLQQFGTQSMLSRMVPKNPNDMLGKIEPDKYTPDSFSQFMRSGNAGDLRPAQKYQAVGNNLVPTPQGAIPSGGVQPVFTAKKEDELERVLSAAGIDIKSPEAQALLKARAVKLATHQPAATSTVKVNSFLPASEEAQRDFMKSSRATYDQLKQAPVLLESLEKAKTLIPGAKGFMGPGGESLLEAAKFLNNRVGTNIATEGVKNAEELRTRIFFNIMDNLKKMDAQPSQMQQQIMQEALGKLGTDPNALPNVLDAFGDVIKGKVDLYNKEVSGATGRGVKFPYDPTIKLPSGAGAVPTATGPNGEKLQLVGGKWVPM